MSRREALAAGAGALGSAALCVLAARFPPHPALPAVPLARAPAAAAPRMAAALTPSAPPAPLPPPGGLAPALWTDAQAALARHGRLAKQDRMGIVDFDAASSQPRFHLVDLRTRMVTSLLVAHGSGSDPAHSGWLERFSNEPGSNATSKGSFLTADYYFGDHGRSQRLLGLDGTNDNARMRAIVVHGAWYAEPQMIARYGKIGRSQGCFAVGDSQLRKVFDHLGTGRLIYATKLA